MNELLYRNLIEPWLFFEDRKIVNRERNWLWGEKLKRNYNRFYLLSDIMIHTGSSCFRYCICNYISFEDRLFYIKNQQVW
jgi:hypothetical protein